MPVYAQVRPDSEDWFIETSATVGSQAPLRSVNKEQLVSAAFSLGHALCHGSNNGFSWVDFCRWTPDERHGMKMHTEESLQLAFSNFGVAVLKKVNVPDCPLFKVVPELFTHSMEFPDTEFPQPNVLPAVVGTDGRLFPVVVQPYQKLFKAVPPVSVNIIV